MNVNLMLCDYACVSEGKLTVVGAGWTFTSQPCPTGVGVLIEIPWDQCTNKHVASLTLMTEDGMPVVDGNGTRVCMLNTIPPVGHPAGTPQGATVPFAIALNCGPLPLAPGSRYEWELAIDGASQKEWRVAFSTRPQQMTALP